MSKLNPKVDGLFKKDKKWKDEIQILRTIALDCPLTEEIKWRQPCYTSEGKNIVLLGRFKDCCVLHFVKGVLLKDAHRLLLKQGEDSQSTRVIRFTSVQQIVEVEKILKDYIQEAIEVEKAGLKVKLKKITEYKIPEELQMKFKAIPGLKAAFTSLTPGRQRGYLIHFSSAKQSKTRISRIEKCLPKILSGKGMDDE